MPSSTTTTTATTITTCAAAGTHKCIDYISGTGRYISTSDSESGVTYSSGITVWATAATAATGHGNNG